MTDNSNNVIALTFGLAISNSTPIVDDSNDRIPLTPLIDENKEIPIDPNATPEADVELAKSAMKVMLRQALQVSKTVGENAVMIGTSDHAESYAAVIKSITDIAKALADTSERQIKRNSNNGFSDTRSNGRTITNNMFVGSTEDLQKLINQGGVTNLDVVDGRDEKETQRITSQNSEDTQA